MEINKIKGVVFDLDGTLYEDTHHFNYYANKLKEKLPIGFQEDFQRDYNLCIDGNHPLKIGRVYDVKKDLILIQKNNIVTKSFQWDGTVLSNGQTLSLYPNPIELNLSDMLSIGDLWWIPIAISRHYGMKEKESYKAFLETREYMMGPSFTMKPIIGLKETLEKIKENTHTILMTNSPEKDSEMILKKLDIQHLFDLKIFEAKKPSLTSSRLLSIAKHFSIEPHELLSIGDNYINEILPAREIGCATIFIDIFNIGEKDFADRIVKNIREIFPLFQKDN